MSCISTPQVWTTPELQELERLAQEIPFDQLMVQWEELAQQRGWPSRSESSLKMRLWRCGLSVRLDGSRYGRSVNTTPARWGRMEEELLYQLAGDVPFPELVERMHRTALTNGWPVRSAKAIEMKLKRTGQRARARDGEWTTTGGAADILGCPCTRIEAWLRRKRIRDVLEPRAFKKFRYISRQAWRRLARQQPRVLGGFDVDRLYALLEDRELAEQVAREHPRPMGDFRIRCVDTGEVWASCSAAARELHVSQAAISLAIRQRRAVMVLGLKFEALRGEGPRVAA
jgi:hypothetical protein